MERYKL